MSAAVDMAVLLPCFTYHSVCCCRSGSIVAKFYLSQGLLLYTWQYCYLVLPITVAAAVCLAVLLPCFTMTVSAAVDLAALLPCFFYHSVCCGTLGSIVAMFYL